MRLLWRAWGEVRGRLAGRRRVFVFLDFDGTLAPIVPSPHRAQPDERALRAIAALAALPRVRVAVISGRPLGFIGERFRARGLYFGGNHGLEMRGPGLLFRHESAASIRPAMRSLAREARAAVGGFPGVFVENKGLTMGIHYRRTPASVRLEFDEAVEAFQRATAAQPVRWRKGKKVWEILPRVKWDKGRAALELLRRAGPAFAVAVGDDATDEDLFRALGRKGLTIRVGRSRNSRAAFYLPRQGDVARFLKLLAEVLA